MTEIVASQRPRLLILDDDPVMREIIAVLAERQGFDTCLVSSPTDFFAELERWKPSHITIDLIMPTQDGIEVLRELASKACSAAITIVSSMDLKVLESAKRVAIERGLNINGVLIKPFKHDALLALLTRVPAGAKARKRTSLNLSDKVTISAQAFQEALRENEFVLYYQPKVSLDTGKVVGVEALVRWRHPLLGLVMPDLFVPHLESLGLISRLTHRVIDIGLAWLSTSGLPDTTSLSINLSALDLDTHTMTELIHDLSSSHGIRAERIILELTETSAMKDPEAALASLTRLRIKGFGLALDDFGTGYSSMVQLARLPFSSMKIDKSFVISMETSSESKKIVGSIISLGHSLGLSIVAEGVETMEVACLLRELGCNTAQGFGIAKPMDAETLSRWLTTWNEKTFVGSMDAISRLSS
jgi:EAL domain-containing protein (putative c-di-GMP-specific phosphodiesterase class I)/CheY-like chemotaxis protein